MADQIDKAFIDLRVKELLQAQGITAKELAERMGKHSQYIYNVINVSPATSLGSLIAIAKALGVPFRDLFGPGEAATGTSSESAAHATCPHCGHELTITIR